MIFDVDGTLVDSNDLHADCWVEAFAHFGKRVEWDVVRGQIGEGGDLLVPDLCNAREMQRFGEALKRYRSELYKEKYMPRVKPFPRVRELLEELRGRGIKLALASSANPEEVEYTTQLLGVGQLLEGSTSKHDAQLSKPSPEIFRAALDQIGTAVETTMTVGDTPYDLLASHRAALSKAEWLFGRVEQLVGEIDRIDEYFSA